MNWSDIVDPSGEVNFSEMAFELVEGLYEPQEVQDLMEERGLVGAVTEINSEYSHRYMRNALRLGRLNGQKFLFSTAEPPTSNESAH